MIIRVLRLRARHPLDCGRTGTDGKKATAEGLWVSRNACYHRRRRLANREPIAPYPSQSVERGMPNRLCLPTHYRDDCEDVQFRFTSFDDRNGFVCSRLFTRFKQKHSNIIIYSFYFFHLVHTHVKYSAPHEFPGSVFSSTISHRVNPVDARVTRPMHSARRRS